MRTPRLTLVSDGKPLRRLLIVSKKWLLVEVLLVHDPPPFPVGSIIEATWRGHRSGGKVRGIVNSGEPDPCNPCPVFTFHRPPHFAS